VDLLRLLPRLLAALSGALVQEAASLHGLVQEDLAFVDARLAGGVRLGDLV
jgi:hypothetical protein